MSMPEEVMKFMVGVSSGCDQLVDAVDDENRKSAIKALVKCAMGCMALTSVPGFDRLGIERPLGEGEEDEFKEKLLKLVEC